MLKGFYRTWVPEKTRTAVYNLRERLARIPRNMKVDVDLWWHVRILGEPLGDLRPFEKKVSSQNGEDGVIQAIFARIGTTNRYFVEFGVQDGTECNTALLLRRGWTGLQMDPQEGNPPFIKKEFVTVENVNRLFHQYGVPAEFDLLSIDIDGNDYWVWKAVSGFRPRVVIVEYNPTIPLERSQTLKYDPAFRFDPKRHGYCFGGSSLAALVKLGREKGYTLVHCESAGINAFFVRDELVPEHFRIRGVAEIYRHRDIPVAGGVVWEEV